VGIKMDKNAKLKDKLFTTKKSVWDGLGAPEEKKLFEFSEGYKKFLTECKIEREAVDYIVNAASKHGYKDLNKATRNDTKLFVNYKGVCAMLVNIGDKSFKDGFKIIASHIDSPQLDLKSNALYEAEDMAYFKTKYYGGIKKYQWVTVPLAMHT
jgi:aspartyl aminopeptidase